MKILQEVTKILTEIKRTMKKLLEFIINIINIDIVFDTHIDFDIQYDYENIDDEENKNKNEIENHDIENSQRNM